MTLRVQRPPQPTARPDAPKYSRAQLIERRKVNVDFLQMGGALIRKDHTEAKKQIGEVAARLNVDLGSTLDGKTGMQSLRAFASKLGVEGANKLPPLQLWHEARLLSVRTAVKGITDPDPSN